MGAKCGSRGWQEPPLHIVEAEKSNEAFLVVQRVCEAFQDLFLGGFGGRNGEWVGT